MSTAKPAKRRQAGNGKAAEQKKQLAKAKKAVKEREETTVRTLMSMINEQYNYELKSFFARLIVVNQSYY